MGRSSFERSKSKFKPQATVLVLCEDSKSSKTYLQDAAFDVRAHVKVEITHCGKTDPKNIVEEAIKRQSKFDQVYCVIDRDRHETFAEAQQLVQDKKKIKLIVSYPCYEYWLLLHFVYRRTAYQATGNKSPADMVIGDLRKQPGMQNYDKGSNGSPFNDLKNNMGKARKDAVRALKDVEQTGEPNPSTELHLLLDRFASLGKLQPL